MRLQFSSEKKHSQFHSQSMVTKNPKDKTRGKTRISYIQCGERKELNNMFIVQCIAFIL